jgi:hypothetical protein
MNIGFRVVGRRQIDGMHIGPMEKTCMVCKAPYWVSDAPSKREIVCSPGCLEGYVNGLVALVLDLVSQAT